MREVFDRYFTEYAAAFNSFDAERLGSFFNSLCLMVNGGFAAPLTSQTEILANLREILKHHEQQQFGSASVSNLVVQTLGVHLSIVTVHWKMVRTDGSLLWEFDNTYNLVDFGEGWKILVSTTHESAT